MSDNSSKEGDIFDDVESFESDGKDPRNPLSKKNFLDDDLLKPIILQKRHSRPEEEAEELDDLIPSKQEALPLGPKSTVVVMSHMAVKHQQPQTPPNALLHKPLPIMQGTHSLAHDMKFGWKPEVAFESAPIPLYFNFVDQPLLKYYQEQAYYSTATGGVKIIYYGPQFKDSFEMHKTFVKPSESTYEFAFPRFYGLASAKAFYDSYFEDEQDGQKPSRDEMREFVGMAPDCEWDELRFNSNFENGNLDMVARTGESTYDLFLRADTNTRGHFGWFHFEISNTKKGRTYHFNIVNMSKSNSLHNYGMQINLWSQRKNQPRFVGWERGGFNIKYGPSRMAPKDYRRRRYYTLSFSYTFEFDDDKIWFANTIPYTFSMLSQYIKAIVAEQRNQLEEERAQQEEILIDDDLPKPKKIGFRKGRYLQESVLCKSLSGVEVPLLTITNFDDPDWQKTKKVVVVQARLHPGETSSSWIVHGLISFLISKSRVANELRKRLVFKIIPMCNPDGVIIGNTRTTLIGRDMNRQFPSGQQNQAVASADSDLPQVEDCKLNPIPYAIRELFTQAIKVQPGSGGVPLVQQVSSQNVAGSDQQQPGAPQAQAPPAQPLVEDYSKIHSFWDIHQHSKKKSIFIYGPYYPLHTDKYLKIRLIPKLLSDRSEMFRFYSCRFRFDAAQKYKENCARVTLSKQFNIANSFTLECSSFGYISKEQRGFTNQFREADLIDFGKSLAESILEYQLLMERDAKAKLKILNRMAMRKENREAEAIKRPLNPQKMPGNQASQSKIGHGSDKGYSSEGEEEEGDEDYGEEDVVAVEQSEQDVISIANVMSEQDGEVVLGETSQKINPEHLLETFGEKKKDYLQGQAFAQDQKSSEDKESTLKVQDQGFNSKNVAQGQRKEDLVKVQEKQIDKPKVKPLINAFYNQEDMENEEEEEDDDEDELKQEEEDKEYEMAPITKPFDLKGLLKIKQKKSKLDISAYQEPSLPTSSSDGVLPEKVPESQGSQEDTAGQIPKHPQATSKVVISKRHDTKSVKNQQSAPRTLDQILSIIQNDIIQEEHEESFEGGLGGTKDGKDDSSDDGGGEDDFLDAHDQRILRDRILHAIAVFSRWSPNPRKQILKQKKAFKLSTEGGGNPNNLRSRAASSTKRSKNSERSNSQAGAETDGHSKGATGLQSTTSPRKFFVKAKQGNGNPANAMATLSKQDSIFNKQQQMDIIDNFLKEYGLMNSTQKQKMGGNQGLQHNKAYQMYQQLNPLNYKHDSNNLTLFGNRIQTNRLSEFDDEVLSTISNEILRFNQQQHQMMMLGKIRDSQKITSNSMKKDAGVGANEVYPSAFSKPQQQSAQEYLQTKLLLDRQLNEILALKLDSQARKIFLQKVFQQQHSNQVQDNFMHFKGEAMETPKKQQVVDDELAPFSSVSNKILTLSGLKDPLKQSSHIGTSFQSNKQSHLSEQKGRPQAASPAQIGDPKCHGFESKLAMLSQVISMKRGKYTSNKKRKADNSLIELQFGIELKQPQQYPRSNSSTNQYQELKHRLVDPNHCNTSILHSSKKQIKRPGSSMQGQLFFESNSPVKPFRLPSNKKKKSKYHGQSPAGLLNVQPIAIKEHHPLLLQRKSTTNSLLNSSQADFKKKVVNAATDTLSPKNGDGQKQKQFQERWNLKMKLDIGQSLRRSQDRQESQRSRSSSLCSRGERCLSGGASQLHRKESDNEGDTTGSIIQGQKKKRNFFGASLNRGGESSEDGLQRTDRSGDQQLARSIISSRAKNVQLRVDRKAEESPKKEMHVAQKTPEKRRSILSASGSGHQIGLYQWNKIHRGPMNDSAAAASYQMLMVRNSAEGSLNLSMTQISSTPNQLQRAQKKKMLRKFIQRESFGSNDLLKSEKLTQEAQQQYHIQKHRRLQSAKMMSPKEMIKYSMSLKS